MYFKESMFSYVFKESPNCPQTSTPSCPIAPLGLVWNAGRWLSTLALLKSRSKGEQKRDFPVLYLNSFNSLEVFAFTELPMIRTFHLTALPPPTSVASTKLTVFIPQATLSVTASFRASLSHPHQVWIREPSFVLSEHPVLHHSSNHTALQLLSSPPSTCSVP